MQDARIIYKTIIYYNAIYNNTKKTTNSIIFLDDGQ